jgi:hypothetical protein
MLYFSYLQYSSIALNSGEPTEKYSTFMLSLFLCIYSFTILDLCWVALSKNITNFLNFFLTFSRYLIKEGPLNLSYFLNSCLPSSFDNTPNTMVLLCEPVIVTIGLFFLIIHFPLTRESSTNIDSSCTRRFQSSLRVISAFCTLF